MCVGHHYSDGGNHIPSNSLSNSNFYHSTGVFVFFFNSHADWSHFIKHQQLQMVSASGRIAAPFRSDDFARSESNDFICRNSRTESGNIRQCKLTLAQTLIDCRNIAISTLLWFACRLWKTFTLLRCYWWRRSGRMAAGSG